MIEYPHSSIFIPFTHWGWSNLDILSTSGSLKPLFFKLYTTCFELNQTKSNLLSVNILQWPRHYESGLPISTHGSGPHRGRVPPGGSLDLRRSGDRSMALALERAVRFALVLCGLGPGSASWWSQVGLRTVAARRRIWRAARGGDVVEQLC